MTTDMSQVPFGMARDSHDPLNKPILNAVSVGRKRFAVPKYRVLCVVSNAQTGQTFQMSKYITFINYCNKIHFTWKCVCVCVCVCVLFSIVRDEKL
jgi:hypothetical protein